MLIIVYFAFVLLFASSVAGSGETWYDARPFVQGTGFPPSEKSAFYDRLPAGAVNTTRGAVWSLSRDTAGMYAQFSTNATFISVNVTYLYEGTTMWHFGKFCFWFQKMLF